VLLIANEGVAGHGDDRSLGASGGRSAVNTSGVGVGGSGGGDPSHSRESGGGGGRAGSSGSATRGRGGSTRSGRRRVGARNALVVPVVDDSAVSSCQYFSRPQYSSCLTYQVAPETQVVGPEWLIPPHCCQRPA